MITLWRIMQSGFRNFMRNAWLSTAATVVMVVTLSFLLVSFIANMSLTATIKGVVGKIDVSIYLKDSTTLEQTKDLQQRLSKVENVQSIEYISKDEALKRFRQQVKNDPKLLGAVNEVSNPLPASFAVKTFDPKKLQPIVAFASQSDVKPFLDSQQPITYAGDRKAAIDRIVRVSNFIKNTGLGASLLFMVISVLIIFNTIRMAIFSRREEIEIMRLVGATNWFIRGPFLFEASLYGVIAAFVAVSLTYGLIRVSGAKIASYIDFASTMNFFSANALSIVIISIVIGVGIGIVSSLLAMTRYLKL